MAAARDQAARILRPEPDRAESGIAHDVSQSPAEQAGSDPSEQTVGRRYYENVLEKTIDRLASYLETHVKAKDLAIDDCQLAAAQFMQMCQASLFLRFIFQAAPAPSAERIAEVVESATRMFLAAYRTKPA